jgi:hypothetical protein
VYEDEVVERRVHPGRSRGSAYEDQDYEGKFRSPPPRRTVITRMHCHAFFAVHMRPLRVLLLSFIHPSSHVMQCRCGHSCLRSGGRQGGALCGTLR